MLEKKTKKTKHKQNKTNEEGNLIAANVSVMGSMFWWWNAIFYVSISRDTDNNSE